MADVVGRAIVEIVPDFSKFASTVQASMKQIIADLERQAGRADVNPFKNTDVDRTVVNPFRDAVKKVNTELGTVGANGSVWTKLTGQAQDASAKVADPFRDCAKQVTASLESAGGGSVWGKLTGDAQAAAGKVADPFKTSAKQIGDSIQSVGSGGAWDRLSGQARETASKVSTEIGGAAKQSSDDIDKKLGSASLFDSFVKHAKAAAQGFADGYKASSQDAERAVKGVGDAAKGAGESSKGLTFSGFIGGAALIGGVTAGFSALKGAITESVAAQQESAALTRVTEQLITTSGNAANVTAGDIDKLTNSLSMKTGIDDEQIRQGSNLLLSFQNVRNEVGAGNDVYNRANAAALDLATVMGTDNVGAAKVLGKALEDPEKGMKALSKAGVVFTDEQKKQVAAMVEAGDTLGAQKVILDEVEKKFGGAASAAADPIARLQVTVGNLKESFGAGLMPVVGVAADAITGLADTLGPALQNIGGAIGGALTPLLEVVGPIATTLLDSFGGLLTGITPGLEALSGAFAETFSTLGPVISQTFGQLGTAIGQLLPVFTPIIGIIGNLVENLLPPLSILFQTVAEVLGNVLGPIFSTLGPIIAQLAQTVGGILTSAFQIIGPILTQIASVLGGAIANAITVVAPLFQQIATVLGGVLVEAIQMVAPFLQQMATLLSETLAKVLPVLIPPLMQLVEVLGGTFSAVLSALLPPLMQVVQALAGALSEALVKLAPPIAKVATVLGGAFATVVEALAPVLTQVAGIVGDMLVGAIEAITPLFDALTPVIDTIAQVFETMAPVIAEVVGVMAELLVQILEPLRPIIPSLVEAFTSIATAFGSLLQALLPLLPPILKLAVLLIETIGVPVLTLLAKTLAMVAQAFAAIVTPIADLLAAGIGQIAELITGLLSGDFSGALDGLMSFFSGIGEMFGSLGGKLVEWFTAAWQWVVDNAGSILSTVGGWLAGVPGQILGWLGDLGGLIVGWITGAWNWVVENGPAILETVLGWWVGIPGQILGWLGDLGALFVGWVTGAWNWVVTNGPAILSTFVGWVTGIPGTIISTLGDIGSKLFDWAKAGFQWVVDKGPDLISGLVDFFRGIPGKLFDALTGAIGAVGGFAADVGGRIWDSVKGFLNDKLIRPLKDKEVSAFGLSIKPFGFLKELAEGGIIRVPTPAIVGEAGPEVVIPLTDAARAKELVLQSGLMGLIEGQATASVGMAVPAMPGAAAAPNVGLAVTPPDTAVNAAPITDAATGAMQTVVQSALTTLQPVADWFVNAPVQAAEALAPFGEVVWAATAEGMTFLRDQVFNTVLLPITNYITNWALLVGTILQPFGEQVWNAISPGLSFFRTQFEAVFGGLVLYVADVITSIRTAFDALPDYFSTLSTQITTSLGSPFSSFASGVWNPFVRGLNAALDQIPATASINIPELPTAHSGGVIGERLPQTGGPLGGDEMVVKMQRGEGVIPVSSMRSMTASQFEAIRSGRGLVEAAPQTDAYVRVPQTGAPYGPVAPAAQGMSDTTFVDASVLGNLKAKIDELKGAVTDRVASSFFMDRFLGGVAFTFMAQAAQFVEAKVNEQNAKAAAALGAGDAFPGGIPQEVGPILGEMASMRGRGGSYQTLIKYLRATGIPHVVTSTIRPGSIIRGTNKLSLHSQARAVDFAGPSGGRDTPELLRIYQAFAPARNLLAEIIYSGPGGNYFGRSGITADDHHDHVHVGLANGAIVTRPMSALLGEAGPEVVLPLTRPMRALQLAQDSGLMQVLAEAQAGRTGTSAAADSTLAGATASGGLFPGSGNTYNIYGVGMEQVIAEIRAREEAAARTQFTRR
jgi:phage-related protein